MNPLLLIVPELAGRAASPVRAAPARTTTHWLRGPAALLLGAATSLPLGQTSAQPRLLSQTGLFEASAPQRIAAGVLPFSPQYPLWSDGTHKRRWLRLPAGRSIDARDPDAWVFPPGTRLWKEFAYDSRVETRFIERRNDGRWVFATYVWTADGSDAELAPPDGAVLRRADAPAQRYDVPSRDDCLACHAGAIVPVLGASAMQLGGELRQWAARGWLRGLPPALLQAPPRIAAANDIERDARGYLHGNCGHCHHPQGVPVRLVLAERVASPAAHTPPPLARLLERMRSRSPITQMPPLGTRLADPHGLAVVQAWLDLERAPQHAAIPVTHPNPQENSR